MKSIKIIKKILSIFVIVILGSLVYAQEENSINTEDELHPKTGFPQIKNVPYIIFNEGIAFSNVTRIQLQTGRSNFVLNDSLFGVYFEIQSQNMKPIDSILRVAAYYPLGTTFNDVPQPIKQTLTYALDMLFVPYFENDMWNYLRIKLGPGIHFMYQLTDDWNYVHLGGGAFLGLELPVTKAWTVLVDGMFTYDYANLGSNYRMMSIDHSWVYQIQAGVRYSKKKSNKYSYIGTK